MLCWRNNVRRILAARVFQRLPGFSQRLLLEQVNSDSVEVVNQVGGQNKLPFGVEWHPGLCAQFDHQLHGRGGCCHFDLNKGRQGFDLALSLPPTGKGGVVESVLADKSGGR